MTVAEIIVFPDTGAAVCTAVRSKLVDLGQATPVGDTVPNPRPTSFVRIERIGGTRRNLVVDDAMLTFEAWHATEQQAHDLAQLVRGITFGLVGQVTSAGTVYAVEELSGPASSPDPLSGAVRYVFTLTVAVRGAAI